MEREYTYAELCRMRKKRVIRIAGYKNIKAALRDGVNKEVDRMGKAYLLILMRKESQDFLHLIPTELE